MSDRLDDKGLVAEYKGEFLNSTDIETKRGLLEAIASLDKINSVYFFIEALTDDDAEIRQEAAIQIVPMVVHPNVVNALIFTLNDKNDDVLIEAIEALSNVHDKRVLAKFKHISAFHSDKLIRDIALEYATKMSGL